MRMSRDPGTFQRIYDVLYVLIGLGCILSLVFAVWWTGMLLNGFPVLFFLAAVLNALAASLRFRMDRRGKNRVLQGVFFLILTFLLLILSYVSAVCIWEL